MKPTSETSEKHIHVIQDYFDNQNQYWDDVYKEGGKNPGIHKS